MKPGEGIDFLEKVVAEHENDLADAPPIVGRSRQLHVAPCVLLFSNIKQKRTACSTRSHRLPGAWFTFCPRYERNDLYSREPVISTNDGLKNPSIPLFFHTILGHYYLPP